MGVFEFDLSARNCCNNSSNNSNNSNTGAGETCIIAQKIFDQCRIQKCLTADILGPARAARANISGWSDASKSLLSGFAKTKFVGYENNSCDAKVIGIISDDMSVEEVTEGEFTLITDKT